MTDPISDTGLAARLRRPATPQYRDDQAGLGGAEPIAVYAPRDAAETAAVLRACRAEGQKLVVQGGRTGLAGGARVLPGEAVLSLERCTFAPEVDPVAATMIVGAGVTLETAQAAARDAGLFLAADLGARGSAQIGGLIATNAGGPLALRYGTFRQQVLGLEAVLPDGRLIRRLSGLAKDNSGYDLSQLLIGSEGTLGVITRACLRLHPQPLSRRVALCALARLDDALPLLQRLRCELGPLLAACELIVEPLLSAACAARGLRHPLPGAAALVLIETAGMSPEADDARLEDTLGALLAEGIATDAVLSQSERESAGLWALREGCSHYLFEIGPITSLDLSLPIPAIPRFVAEGAALLAQIAPDTRAHAFGHLGDGNLHYVLTGHQPEPVLRAVFALTAGMGGAITAEHGIGLDKVAFLPLCRPPDEIAAMRAIKAALDPDTLLNPGRILG